MLNPRSIKLSFVAPDIVEGGGMHIKKGLGTPAQPHLSPFLMLDHAIATSGTGFGDHPHRGFETVTYMIEGQVYHEDSSGHRGTLRAGDVQWMTAGRGILHSERPGFENSARSAGLQLWIDLPAADKLCDARYQGLLKEEIPMTTSSPGVKIKVISGSSNGISSPVQTKADIQYLDIEMIAGSTFRQSFPQSYNVFIYTLEGEIQVDKAIFGPSSTVIFKQDGVEVSVFAVKGARFVLLAGRPLDQEIHTYGPFVAASKHGIQEALADYRAQRNGFEAAGIWQSGK